MSINIIQGECLEELRKLENASVDLVLTDPPFKVSQNYGGGVDADNLMNVASILRVIPQIDRILKPGKFFITFYDNRILPFLFEAVRGSELNYKKSIFLYRRWGAANRWMGWMQCTDPICFFVKGHEQPFTAEAGRGRVKHDTYVKGRPEAYDAHTPAQKPLDLVNDLVLWCSNKDDLVVDPYLGSGTTAIACAKLKRRCLGIEINSDYCKIAKDRVRPWLNQTELLEQTLTVMMR